MRRPLSISRALGGLAAAALLLVARPALACSVCFGATDSAMAAGTNNAIFFLLGIVGVVQVGFVALFVGFRRRARRLAEKRAAFQLIDGAAR